MTARNGAARAPVSASTPPEQLPPMRPAPLRRPLDLRAIALVLLLCGIWGVQQVVMKSVAADVAPIMQLAVRFAGAAIFFGLLVAVREGRCAFADGTLRSGLVLGLMFSLEFVLAGSALVHTSAAHTIVFLYSAPIFTALGLQFIPEERLSGVQWTGITAAFFGIVVAFVGPGSRPVPELILGDFLALLGGAAWGLTNVVLRRGRVGGANTAKTVLYQVGIAALVSFAFASVTGQTRMVLSGAAILSLSFQTVFISIISYLVWFWLLRHYLTSRLMLLSLLTPLLGVLFGALLLREPIESRFAIGSALVLAGISFVNSRMARKPLRSAPRGGHKPMDDRNNQFGQPTGALVPGWTARQRPPRETLHGRYCRLEPVEVDVHAADLYAAYMEAPDDRDWTYLFAERPRTPTAFREYLAALAVSADPLHYVIVDAGTTKPVGTAALMRIEPIHGVIEVGCITYSPRLKRTRAGTEAMYLLMHLIFDELGYRRYEWKCDSLNAASRSAAGRYGFTFEGIFRRAIVYKGRSRDTAWYSIVADEWPRIRSAFEAWLDPENFDDAGGQRRRLSASQASP